MFLAAFIAHLQTLCDKINVLGRQALKWIPTFKAIAHFTPMWKIEIRYVDGIFAAT